MRSGPTWPPSSSKEPTIGETIVAFSNQKNAILTDVAEDYVPEFIDVMLEKSGGHCDVIDFENKLFETLPESRDFVSPQTPYTESLSCAFIADDRHAIIVKKQSVADKAMDTNECEDGFYATDALQRLSAYAQDELTGRQNVIIFNDPVRVQGFKSMIGL